MGDCKRLTLASNGAGFAHRHGEPQVPWNSCPLPILLLGVALNMLITGAAVGNPHLSRPRVSGVACLSASLMRSG